MAITGLVGLFLYSSGCGETAPAEDKTTVTPDTPDTPDQSDTPKGECAYPDKSESCKASKGAGFTCLPDGSCAQCQPGLAGCPCVGEGAEPENRYCLAGQGKCLAASMSAAYSEPFCGWCLQGQEYCPCTANTAAPCASGLKCASVGDAVHACVKDACSSAGGGENCPCPAGDCSEVDQVCWDSLCRTCPDSVAQCPCDQSQGCSSRDGLVCSASSGEAGVKRCARAASCAELGCVANVLCCDSSNSTLAACATVAADDQVKCLAQCLPGWASTGGGTCNECASGFFGADCSEECPGGAETPCSDHGTCSQSGQCECDAGYGGASCGSCASGYVGASCNECPGGAGNPCSGHGDCTEAASGDAECTCLSGTGWSGPDCSICPAGYQLSGGSCMPEGVSCSPDCGAHGQCTAANSTNSCKCGDGWAGAACDACDSGYFGADCAACPGGDSTSCSGNGTCDEGLLGSGACTCVGHWTGADCSGCPDGYDTTGGGCTPQGITCTQSCGEHGQCTAIDTCTCNPGWTGPLCATCESGYFGASCAACPGGASNPCSGHGTCDSGSGECDCSLGWFGDACENTCGGGERLENGACVDIDECQENNGGCGPQARVSCANATASGDAPVCSCRDNSGGRWERRLTCQVAGSLVCQQYGALDCTNDNGDVIVADSPCAVARAACTSGATAGECVPRVLSAATCDQEGADCVNPQDDTQIGQCVKQVLADEVCASVSDTCGTDGVCEEEPLDCSKCQPGYFGLECKSACPGGAANPCNGHGACGAGISGDGACACTTNTGWTEDDCNTCIPGWDNSAGLCDTEINECERDTPCSHGTCTDLLDDYSCACEEGWAGEDCDIPLSANLDGVLLADGYYQGGAGVPYSVGGAAVGASNGCASSSEGAMLVFVPEAANSAFCANECCDVLQCRNWDDCDAVPDTYCTQAHSDATDSYCLPKHPGLREHQRMQELSGVNKLWAINLSDTSVTAAGSLFTVRDNSATTPIFEWGRLKESAFQEEDVDRCSNDGLTGDLWPVTTGGGKRVCVTLPDFSLDVQGVETMPCDEDGDGWIQDMAYGDVNSSDAARRANARCNVRVITDWVLINEYLQKLRVPVDSGLTSTATQSNSVPWWICPSASSTPAAENATPCVPLIETRFLDGVDTDDGSGLNGGPEDRIGYKLSDSSSAAESILPAGDASPLVKACTSHPDTRTKSDYNKNGVEDWKENQDSGTLDASSEGAAWAGSAQRPIYAELQKGSYFRELYTGSYDDTLSVFTIRERPRCDLGANWPQKIALGFNEVAGSTGAVTAGARVGSYEHLSCAAAASETACDALCLGNERCTAWNYHANSGDCCLKSGWDSVDTSAGYVDSWVTGLRSHSPKQWQSCMRAPGAVEGLLNSEVDEGTAALFGETLPEPGLDFARYYWAKKTKTLANNNYANYVTPATFGIHSDKVVAPSDVLGTDNAVNASMRGFVGGWCSLDAYGEATIKGFYGKEGAALQHLGTSESHENGLLGLVGQEFEVSAGKMQERDCGGNGDCAWRGMNHFSQFQCVQVSQSGWSFSELAGSSSDYEYTLNECEEDSACTQTGSADCLRCRRLKVSQDGSSTCDNDFGGATCDTDSGIVTNENKVGFVAVRYRFEGDSDGMSECANGEPLCPQAVDDRADATAQIGQRNHIPVNLRGCVADEFYDEHICPSKVGVANSSGQGSGVSGLDVSWTADRGTWTEDAASGVIKQTNKADSAKYRPMNDDVIALRQIVTAVVSIDDPGDSVGLLARYRPGSVFGSTTYYLANLYPKDHGHGSVAKINKYDETWIKLDEVSVDLRPDTDYLLSFKVKDNGPNAELTMTIDGVVVATHTDTSPLAAGYPGLYCDDDNSETVGECVFSDFYVTTALTLHGVSHAHYGGATCYKEPSCGDGINDSTERCDPGDNSNCISEGSGACLCERVDCPVGSTNPDKVVCNPVDSEPVDWPASYCENVTCEKTFANGPGGQPGTLAGEYGQTLDFTCGDGHEGGDGWTCGANGEFSGGRGCPICPEGKFSTGGDDCEVCAGATSWRDTTEAGSSTCNTDCRTDLEGNNLKANIGCGESLAQDAPCTATCKDGYFVDSDNANNSVTLKCTASGIERSDGMSAQDGGKGDGCVSRSKAIKDYGVSAALQSNIMLWISGDKSAYFDSSTSKAYDLTGRNVKRDMHKVGAGVTHIGDWFEFSGNAGLKFSGGGMTDQIKTLAIVFKPTNNIGHEEKDGEDSLAGLLSFNDKCTQGVHLGEYFHKESTSNQELITVVGDNSACEGGGSPQGYYGLSNTTGGDAEKLNGGKTYILILRNNGSRTKIKVHPEQKGGDATVTSGKLKVVREFGVGYAIAQSGDALKLVDWEPTEAIATGDMLGQTKTSTNKFNDASTEALEKVQDVTEHWTKRKQDARLKAWKDGWSAWKGKWLRLAVIDYNWNNALYCLNGSQEAGGYSCTDYHDEIKDWPAADRAPTNGTLDKFLDEYIPKGWNKLWNHVNQQEGSVQSGYWHSKVKFAAATIILDDWSPGGKKYFNGKIGEVILFNTELNDAETAALMEGLKAVWE